MNPEVNISPPKYVPSQTNLSLSPQIPSISVLILPSYLRLYSLNARSLSLKMLSLSMSYKSICHCNAHKVWEYELFLIHREGPSLALSRIPSKSCILSNYTSRPNFNAFPTNSTHKYSITNRLFYTVHYTSHVRIKLLPVFTE
jgi:hypothetical protein